jgi:hypothetical protein
VSEEHWMVAWKMGWLGDDFMWAGQVMAGYKSTWSGGDLGERARVVGERDI